MLQQMFSRMTAMANHTPTLGVIFPIADASHLGVCVSQCSVAIFVRPNQMPRSSFRK